MKVSSLILVFCPHETLRTNMIAVRAALLFEGKSCGCAGLERQFLRQHVKVEKLGDANSFQKNAS